jgi:hypothetical protein
MMGARPVLLVCVSLAIAAWPVGMSPEEINPAELAILAAAFATVLAAQCGLLWLAGRFAGDRVADGLMALLIAANAHHFAFLTLEARTLVRVSLALAVGLGAWMALRAGITRARVLLFTLVFTTLSLGQYAYGRITLSEAERKITSAPGAIPVKSNRNVYLISTESLHSPYAFRRLYGIENAPHVAYLKAEGFRVFDRAYSVETTTRLAYQRIMEYSKPLTSVWEVRRVLKSGNSTFKSFQDAGYGIQFIYTSNYMALNHALVDHAYPETGFYICDNLRPSFFYFICRQPVRTLINEVLFGVKGKVTVGEEIAHLEERIRIAAADTRPWLTISHIAFPGHTPHDHRYDDASKVAAFRERTRSRIPQIASHYRQIVSTIKRHDPDAVIVTFGDHGMWLTRGMKPATPNAIFTVEDYIEDRYGVMIGVYPADFCTNRIFEGSSTSLLAKSVIECLNGNDAPTPEDLERSRSVVYLGETRTLDSIAAAP